MTERRPYDPFSPHRDVSPRRPRRSTAEQDLPSWLFDAMRERGVPDAAFAPLTTQFGTLSPAERAAALADLQGHRQNQADLDDLAAALIDYHETGGDPADVDAGDAQEPVTSLTGENTSEPVTPASDDQGSSGGDPGVVTVTADDVPKNANEAVAWIGDAEDDDALRVRARLVLAAEMSYPGAMRKTIRQALDLALGASAVQSAIDERG